MFGTNFFRISIDYDLIKSFFFSYPYESFETTIPETTIPETTLPDP